MLNRLALLLLGLMLLMAWQVPPPAMAAEDGSDAAPLAREAVAPWGGQPLAAEALAGYRGGADVHSNDMNVDGVVRENQAYNLTTGTNLINGGAFANASGVPMVVQNSGNNVLIQNATILNLQMK